MRRRTFFLGLGGLAGCTSARKPRLYVMNWSNYIAPDTVPSFEAEFGVRVRYSVYESAEEMLAKVITGNSGCDVVFPPSNILAAFRENHLAAPLRHEWLPNLDNLDERFRAPSWDPGLEYQVPYGWGTTGILYNRKLRPPPDAWASMWEDRLRNRLTMLDDPADVFAACLKKLGHSLNSTDPEHLRAAQREAIAQKRLLRAYLNSEVRDQAVAGDVLAAQLWVTTAVQAIDEADGLAFAFPKEGFALYCDGSVVLAESPRARLAHEFINYLLRPKVAANFGRTVRTATTNRAGRMLLDAAERDHPMLYPDAETLGRGEWFEALPPETIKLRDRLWTEIKAA